MGVSPRNTNTTTTTWTLGHRPALDGLRGVAILLVIAYHDIPGFRAGGVVGVTLFFALSGFLITSGLVEAADRGRLSLRTFYERRARRLLPALFVMLAIVGALSIVAHESSVADLAAVVFYGANWWRVTGHELGGMLAHTWTLSAEEQFYFVWPIVFMWARRSARLMLALGVVAVLLPVARIVFETTTGASNVAYFTAGDALVAGCALAVWMSGRTIAWRPSAFLVVAVLAALVAVSWLAVPVSVTLAVAGLIGTGAVALAAGSVAQLPLLTWPVLRWIGRRSYGLYLWHLPVRYLVEYRLILTGVDPWLAIVAGLAVTVALVELSWRFVELPFLRSGDRLDRGPVPPAGAVPIDRLDRGPVPIA